MKTLRRTLLIAGILGIVALPGGAHGADHTDSPAASDDPAADIADFYAWHTDGGRLVLVLDFAGLQAAGSTGTYDADMLYGFHIDRDGDHAPDHDIWVRFGQNGAGEWGVQVEGLPGEETFSGPVDTVLTSDGGAQVYAGPREDPFFFDFEGFLETLDTGTLSFDPERSVFDGTNVTSIVVEVDLAAAADGSEALGIWATSGRKG